MKKFCTSILILCVSVLYSQTSDFGTNTEGWLIVGDGGGFVPPTYVATGGNPGGYISSKDEGTGGTWYFSAPAKFLGNKSWFYGKNLKFDLKQSRIDQQFGAFDSDIIIQGNGITIAYNTSNNPGVAWTSYFVRLDEIANWRINNVNILSRKASQAEIKTVLCNVTKLWIRGEFVDGADEGGLDNALIEGTDCSPKYTVFTPRICQGQVYAHNGKNYTTTGSYTDTIRRCNPLCDSILVINLTVSQPATKTQVTTICASDSLKIGNRFLKSAGNYRDTFKTTGGCDSVVLTQLIVNPLIVTTQNLAICEGDFLKIGDNIYTKAGNYRTVLKGTLGCDSVVTTNLTVNTKALKTVDTTICVGKSVRVGNKIYTQAGTFTDTVRRRAPLCDSIVNVKIKYSPLPEVTERVTICKNDPVYVRGRLFSGAGSFRDTIKSYTGGCDTIFVTNVAISSLLINVGSNLEIERGDSVKLTPLVVGSTNNSLKWQWSPARGLSCVNCPNPISRPDKSVTYIVEARDTTGNCTAKDSLTISVKACERVYIPNAFSPNNDGNNDTFIAYAADCAAQIKHISIFSRGGQLVFDAHNIALNNPQSGWDGTFNNKPLQTGVYIYVIEIEYRDKEVKTFSGDLNLIR